MIFLWLACSSTDKISVSQDTDDPNSAVQAVAGLPISGWVGETIYFDGSGSTGETFEWYFGDGQTSTVLNTSHVFTEPGIYQAVLTAYGTDGQQHTDATSVSIQHPPTEQAPVVSSPIIATDGSIWALFPENGSLSHINSSGQLVEEWSICSNPQQMAFSDGVIGISCRKEASLVLFNVETGDSQTILLPPHSQPYGIVGQEDSWWITLSSTGELLHFDGQHQERIPLGPDLRGLSLLSDGSLMSPQWRSTAEGAAIYHYDSGMVREIKLGIDYNGDSDNTTGGVPNLLEHVMPTLDGRTLFVPMLHANVLRGQFLTGEPLTFETTLRAMLAKVELSDGIENASERKHFDERGRSLAAVPSITGDRLYVLHPSAGHISILDRTDLEIIGSILNVGVGASGLAIGSEGKYLYVHGWLDRKIRSYRIDDGSNELQWEASLSNNEPLTETELLGKKVFHSAADPRITRSQYIACTHCHPGGDQDGQVWDFTDRGEGLRNTSSLLGRGAMEMGPLHWTGNFDEIQDFEVDLREHFGGTGFINDSTYEECADSLGESKAGLSVELDALADYLETLPLPSSAPHGWETDNGELFVGLGCDSCHPAPLYTDSSLETFLRHDVGTLKLESGLRLGEEIDGLDTPTLLGLWNSGPYLHDGSTDDLAEAIRMHEGFGELTDNDILILINFLYAL